jgi:hypothetical protein
VVNYAHDEVLQQFKTDLFSLGLALDRDDVAYLVSPRRFHAAVVFHTLTGQILPATERQIAAVKRKWQAFQKALPSTSLP